MFVKEHIAHAKCEQPDTVTVAFNMDRKLTGGCQAGTGKCMQESQKEFKANALEAWSKLTDAGILLLVQHYFMLVLLQLRKSTTRNGRTLWSSTRHAWTRERRRRRASESRTTSLCVTVYTL